MNHFSSEDYNCIGGEGWYTERCSRNFLINVPMKLFSDVPVLKAPFRSDACINLGNIQHIRLSEDDRKHFFESVEHYMLRASSGILKQKNDSRYELASFQELSLLVHTPSPYEEVFVRRNAVLLFLHRILRSAQTHNGSLRPSYPGSLTCCTCGQLPHLEYCPLHDVFDEERGFCILRCFRGIASFVVPIGNGETRASVAKEPLQW